mmetsp:Transcript_81832/g.227949  ORF Transcript_81832/g.227949 Transcript_81832/m.227949 type:complete len:297 (-) Transcript_81832:2905-3795(-)
MKVASWSALSGISRASSVRTARASRTSWTQSASSWACRRVCCAARSSGISFTERKARIRKATSAPPWSSSRIIPRRPKARAPLAALRRRALPCSFSAVPFSAEERHGSRSTTRQFRRLITRAGWRASTSSPRSAIFLSSRATSRRSRTGRARSSRRSLSRSRGPRPSGKSTNVWRRKRARLKTMSATSSRRRETPSTRRSVSRIRSRRPTSTGAWKLAAGTCSASSSFSGCMALRGSRRRRKPRRPASRARVRRSGQQQRPSQSSSRRAKRSVHRRIWQRRRRNARSPVLAPGWTA